MELKILNDIPLSLSKESLFRRMGYGGRQRLPAHEVLEQFDRAMVLIERESYIKANYTLMIQEISLMSEKIIKLKDGCEIPGKRIFNIMPQATHLAIAIGTIGDKLETISRDLVKQGDPLIGVILDSIGSAAVDCLAEEISKHVSNCANEIGLMSSSPVSPGMPGLPLSSQQVIFSHLPADRIGVSLTASNMIIPFKSSSMIYGLGKAMPTWSKTKVCKACHLYKHCRYKIVN